MCVCVCIQQFVYTSIDWIFAMDGYLGYFHLLITINSADMNMCVKLFVWDGGTDFEVPLNM